MSFTSPDLIGSMYQKYSDGQVRIIVRLDGRLDEGRLSRAVRLAFDAEPITGCRFVNKPVRPYWQRCTDLESAFVFHAADAVESDKGVDDFYLAPFDPFNGPQVRVGLYRSDDDTLYIKMSHIMADGGASIEYVRLLSSIYRKLEQEPEYVPPRNLDGRRSSFQALKYVRLNRIVSSCKNIRVSMPAWKFSSRVDGQVSPSLFVRRIGPRQLSTIKKFAKENGATMGDVLMTAYYRALFEVIDPPENVPMPLLVPVNIRRYIPGGGIEGMCNLSGAYFPKVARVKDEPFEETLAKVHKVMEWKKARQEELGQLFILEHVLAPGNIVPRILDPFFSSILAAPMFSNLGVVDPSIADFGDVGIREILPTGPTISPPYFTLGMSTFNGEMAVTSTVCGTDEYKVRVERFFDVFLYELPGYVPEEPERAVEERPASEMAELHLRERPISEA